MEGPGNRFDPPESVVSPAFGELLLRLNRARMSPRPDSDLPQEERLLFDNGVTQRRQVLEHTLFLVFGQWAIYRQFVTRLTWRPARVAYACSAVASSIFFVRKRASLVTRELFEKALTADYSNALANEARIILAEMEGPEGPYFRSVCQARGFQSVLPEGEVHMGGDETDTAHPQLRLTPRLLTADAFPPGPLAAGMPGRAREFAGTQREGVPARGLPDGLADSRAPGLPTGTRAQRRDEAYGAIGAARRAPFVQMRGRGVSEVPVGGAEHADGREKVGEALEVPQDWVPAASWGEESGEVDRSVIGRSEGWGQPFDFSTGARGSQFDEEAGLAVVVEEAGSVEETPSQRRARERRMRRLQAVAKGRGRSEEMEFPMDQRQPND